MKTLETSAEVLVRFSETDAMGVVWHGNYLKFFEDAREEFGREFGMEYLTMYSEGFVTPIVKSNIDHKNPVYYGQKVRIKTFLHFKPAAKIVFTYEVFIVETNQLAAKGSTTQVFLNAETRVLELQKPEFYAKWENEQKWKVNG